MPEPPHTRLPAIPAAFSQSHTRKLPLSHSWQQTPLHFEGGANRPSVGSPDTIPDGSGRNTGKDELDHRSATHDEASTLTLRSGF
jgi:hypothetical protein